MKKENLTVKIILTVGAVSAAPFMIAIAIMFIIWEMFISLLVWERPEPFLKIKNLLTKDYDGQILLLLFFGAIFGGPLCWLVIFQLIGFC